MAELKTKQTNNDVDAFIDSINDERKRQDSRQLLQIMKEITGENPTIWGTAIIGFCNYHYKYASGREGDWFKIGFSPRKQNISIYLIYGMEEFGDLLEKLGKHKLGKGCLYINRLEQIDIDVLKELIVRSLAKHNTSD